MDDRIEMIDDKFITKGLCDPSYPISNGPALSRQRRLSATHADRHGYVELERISKDGNPRSKRRSKPQHCPSCDCQSGTDHSPSSRFNDTPRRKNPEKLGPALSRRVNYSTSKVASFPMGNGHSRLVATSPRSRNIEQRTTHQRYHPSDTLARQSQERNTLENASIPRRSQKDESVEDPKCARIDSPLGEIVNAELDMPTAQTNFRLSNESMDCRKIRKEPNFRNHFSSGEPHSQRQIDRLPNQRCQDYSQSKRWHSSQRVSVRDDSREDEMEARMEIQSMNTREDWHYDRDQREPKDQCDGVRQLMRLGSAGWNKQHREQTERREDSRETLERINRLVSKLPISRQGNGNRVATLLSPEERQSKKKNSIEQLRDRTSKSDERANSSVTRNGSSAMDACIGPSIVGCAEVEKTFEEELFDIEGEEEPEAASETEEEARQLAASKKMQRFQFERQFKKISQIFETKLIEKNRVAPRTDEYDEKKEEIECGKSSLRRKGIRALECFKGKRDKKEVKTNGVSKPLSATLRNLRDRSDPELLTNTHGWQRRGDDKNKTDDKMHGEPKHHSYWTLYDPDDPEFETSKVKNRIDDTIGRGTTLRRSPSNATELNYEATRESDQVLAERLNIDESIKTKGENRVSGAVTRESEGFFARPIQGDCCIDSKKWRDSEREIKNRRWKYLNDMRSDLDKLFQLERCLDTHLY